MLLAPWRLGKNTATSERNDLIKSAVAIDPVPIQPARPARCAVRRRPSGAKSPSPVILTDKQALVRLRSVEERPAIEVLTPFRVARE